jgi:hypothetical protein
MDYLVVYFKIYCVTSRKQVNYPKLMFESRIKKKTPRCYVQIQSKEH